MPTSQLRARIAVLRAEACAIGAELAERGSEMERDELFEISGELQGAANAVEGAQLVAMAHAASHESRLTDRGFVEVHHGLGFVDPMAPSLVSLEAGIGEWAAGRRVSLAAKVSERFPRLLGKVVAGELTTATVAKVVSVCDGLDLKACASVEAVLVDRLPGLDPARVTSVIRRVATRIAADQMRQATRKNRKDRFVEVCAGPDGTTCGRRSCRPGRPPRCGTPSSAMATPWPRTTPALTLDQARADALADLVLSNVTVTAKVTLGIPVITGTDAVQAKDAAAAAAAADGRTTGVAGAGLGADFSVLAALNGCEVPGIGFIDADTVEALLAVVPTDIGRALLDARTGALIGVGDQRLPTAPRDEGLRRHPRRHLPDVGMHPPSHGLRHRPRPTLARRPHHPHQPRRALPPTPPTQATPPLGLPARPRRHRQLDLTQRQTTDDLPPTRPLATGRTRPTRTGHRHRASPENPSQQSRPSRRAQPRSISGEVGDVAPGEGEQLADAHRLRVGCREGVGGRELPAGEPGLEPEDGQVTDHPRCSSPPPGSAVVREVQRDVEVGALAAAAGRPGGRRATCW